MCSYNDIIWKYEFIVSQNKDYEICSSITSKTMVHIKIQNKYHTAYICASNIWSHMLSTYHLISPYGFFTLPIVFFCQHINQSHMMRLMNQLMMAATKKLHFEFQNQGYKRRAIADLFTNATFYLKVVACWTCCERDGDDEEEWRKRQTTDISSIAIPRLFFFQARTACSTNRLAALGRSAVEETISIASWFVITSHIFYIQTKNKKQIGQ